MADPPLHGQGCAGAGDLSGTGADHRVADCHAQQFTQQEGARLFINWVLSREGQLLQYYKSYVIPAHKDLDQPRFNSVYDLVKGKKKSIRDEALLGGELHKKMLKIWNAKWTNPVGKGRKKKVRKKKKKD